MFDAAGMGRLVITNGALGATETFGGLLPVWADVEDLGTLLKELLADPDALGAKAAALQKEVLAKHTYRRRAVELKALLQKHDLLPERGLSPACHKVGKANQVSWIVWSS